MVCSRMLGGNSQTGVLLNDYIRELSHKWCLNESTGSRVSSYSEGQAS